MTLAVPDCVVVTLIEIRGGAEKWQRVERKLDELGWLHRQLSTKERRIAHRAYGVDTADSGFRWVEIPVAGSSWRADREASWLVTQLSRAAHAVVYDRFFPREGNDRDIEPEWQAYSTRAFLAPGRTRLRRAGLWAASRTGLLDVGRRVRGPRDAALHLVRHLSADAPRPELQVRPLDGRGRTGTVQYREDALNRALALFMAPLFAMGLLLVLARQSRPLGIALCGLLALACAGVASWTALALPVARTRLRSAAVATVATALVTVYSLGIPGVSTGLSPSIAVGVAAVSFYGFGLVVLGRRWKWQALLVGVGPLLATVAVAALPLTGRFLHDTYADELSLSPGETEVSGIWQLAAAVKLLWPSFGTVLFVCACWGILRYFHFIRPGSTFAAICAALTLVLALTTTIDKTLDSPQRAAERLRSAAISRTEPPGYFGVGPEWVCVRPTVPRSKLNEEGGTLAPRTPYLSFGSTDGDTVLWNRATDQPLRVPSSQVRITPWHADGTTCMSGKSAADEKPPAGTVAAQ